MNRARHLLRSSIIVILFLGLGKVTGLGRVVFIASAFGTSLDFDAFTAANQLPEVFFTLIAGGALAAAFIPVYSDVLTSEKSRESARLANTILTLVLAVLGTISLFGAIFAPWLTRVVLTPGFAPEQQQLTAVLMRIILIQTTLFGIGGVLSSILNAHQHFALPALAPISLDIGYVAGFLFFVPELGIIGLAWGTVIGGLLNILIQLPALWKYKIRYRPAWGLEMAGVQEIIRLMGPRIVTLGAIQLADLYIIRLSSALPAGSTSAYFYGYSLMQIPQTLFGTAVAIVVFPTLAELFNAGQLQRMKETAVQALIVMWTLTIPAAFLLVLLGEQAIVLVLERGSFDATSTRLVYTVLVVFSVRIVSETTLEMVARLFYAQHDTRTPMFAYIGWLLVNLGAAFVLVQLFNLGIAGLALASTIAFTLLAGVLFWLNGRRLNGMNERDLGISALRALAASGMMALGVIAWERLAAQIGLPIRLTNFLSNVLPAALANFDSLLAELLLLALTAALGVLIYIIFNLLLGGKEIHAGIRLIRRQ